MKSLLLSLEQRRDFNTMLYHATSFVMPPMLLCNAPQPLQGWKYSTYVADDFPVDIQTAARLVHAAPADQCPWPATSVLDGLPVLPSEVYSQYALVSTLAIVAWFVLVVMTVGRR